MAVEVIFQTPEGDKRVNITGVDSFDDSPEVKANLLKIGERYGATDVDYPVQSPDKVEMAPEGPPDAPGDAEGDGFRDLSSLVTGGATVPGTVRPGSGVSPLEQSSPDLITTENAIKVAKFGGGLGTEIATGLSGQALGTAIGAFGGLPGILAGYTIGSLAGGFLGSLAAQKIEGQDINLGRAFAAGIVNLFPSGAAIKGGLKTTQAVAPAAMRKMASKEFAKGVTPSLKALTALSKASDAPLTKKLTGGRVSSRVADAALRGGGIGAVSVQADMRLGGDKDKVKRFATPLETLKGVAIGAGFGAGLDVAANKLMGAIAKRSKKAPVGETTEQQINRLAYESPETADDLAKSVNSLIDDAAISKLKESVGKQTSALQSIKSAAPISRKDINTPQDLRNSERFDRWVMGGEDKGLGPNPIKDTSLNSLAAINKQSGQIKFNWERIKEDWDNDLAYLRGEANDLPVSKQKAKVFEDIDLDKFKIELGSPEAYAKFIFAHEIGHKTLQKDIAYPKDLMAPKTIALERQANEEAARLMGIDWSLLSKAPPKATKTDSAPDVFSDPISSGYFKTGDLFEKPLIKPPKLKATGHKDAYTKKGTIVAGPRKGETYSTEIPETHDWKIDIKKGEPFSADVYQGRGKTREEIYSENSTSKSPVAGEAEYYALNESHASNFGEVTKHTVSLYNPFVIKSGKDLDKILEEIKAEGGNLRGYEEYWGAIVGKIKDAGHDGIYVEVDQLNELEGRKYIAQTFGDSQIIKFRTPKQQSEFEAAYLGKIKEVKRAYGNMMEDGANQQIKEDASDTLKAANRSETVQDERTAWKKTVDFTNRLIAPSFALNNETARAVERAINYQKAVSAAGTKHLNAIAAYVEWGNSKFNQSKFSGSQIESDVNKWINGYSAKENNPPESIKGITNDLIGYRNIRNQSQANIANIIGPDGDPVRGDYASRKELLDTIQKSIVEQNYATNIYGVFIDKNWKRPSKVRTLSVNERFAAIALQLIKREQDLIMGGAGRPAGVEKKLLTQESRGLQTDWAGAKKSILEQRNRELNVLLADVAKKKEIAERTGDRVDQAAYDLDFEKYKKAQENISQVSLELTQAEIEQIYKKAYQLALAEHAEKEAQSFAGRAAQRGKLEMVKALDDSEAITANILMAQRKMGPAESTYWDKKGIGLEAANISQQNIARLEAGLMLDRDLNEIFIQAAGDPNSPFGKVFINQTEVPAGAPNYQKLLQRTNLLDRGIYVDSWVNGQLAKLLNENNEIVSSSQELQVAIDVLTSGTTIWKGMKTLLNAATWPVNLVGSIWTMTTNGVLPTFSNAKSWFNGVRIGLNEYEWLDQRASSKMTTAQRVQAVEEYKELVSLGIFSENVSMADMMRSNPQNLMEKVLKGILTPAAKAYNIVDNAARLTIFVHNQKVLTKMFPGIEGDLGELKRVAAEMTLAGAQAYGRLNKNIGTGSRLGALDQFVAFNADLVRSSTNQAIGGAKMLKADEKWLRKKYRIKGGRFNATQSRMHGFHILSALLAVSYGAISAVRRKNEREGYDREEQEALSRSYVPFWMKNKENIFKKRTKEDPMTVNAVQSEYLFPAVGLAGLFKDLIRDPARFGQDVPERIKNMFLGEGNPMFNMISSIHSGDPDQLGPDAEGMFRRYAEDLISVGRREMMPGTFKDIANYILANPKEFQLETVRLAQEISPSGTRLTQAELKQRLLGYRITKVRLDESFAREVREQYTDYKELLQEMKSLYQERIGNEPDLSPNANATRDEFIDSYLKSNNKKFDLIIDRMSVLIKDTVTAKIFDNPELGVDDRYLVEALKMSSASNPFKLKIVEGIRSGNFELPLYNKKDMNLYLTDFESSRLTGGEFAEVFAQGATSIAKADSVPEMLGEAKDFKTRIRGTIEEMVAGALREPAEISILKEMSVEQRVNYLVEEGIDPNSNRGLELGQDVITKDVRKAYAIALGLNQVDQTIRERRASGGSY
jgi:hypothetical protein